MGRNKTIRNSNAKKSMIDNSEIKYEVNVDFSECDNEKEQKNNIDDIVRIMNEELIRQIHIM